MSSQSRAVAPAMSHTPRNSPEAVIAKTRAMSPESLWTQSTPGFRRLATMPEASRINSLRTIPARRPGPNSPDCRRQGA